MSHFFSYFMNRIYEFSDHEYSLILIFFILGKFITFLTVKITLNIVYIFRNGIYKFPNSKDYIFVFILRNLTCKFPNLCHIFFHI